MSNRVWVMGTVLVCIAILLLGGLFFIKPKVDEIVASTAAVVTTASTNAQYELDLQALKAQYENLDAVKKELEDLRTALPSGPEHAALIRDIDAAAAAAGIAPFDYTTSIPVIYGATDATGGETTAANPGSISGGTLVAIPIVVGFTLTDPTPVFQFMDNLRLGSRLVLIYDWSATPDSEESASPVYTFTINIYAYSLLDPNEDVAQPDPNATPTAPTPTATPTDGATPSPTDTLAPVTP